MPLYEYVCQGCQQRFEKLVRAWGEAVSCPACQGQSVEKQLSVVAFSGFATGGGSAPAPRMSGGGGGCCGGGGCGCGH